MTIENLNSRWDYIGDGIVTSFSFDNLVVKDTDLLVYQDTVLQTITVDYTVTGAGTKAGSVDFLVAPANTVAVAILRNTERDQTTAYPSNNPFPSKSHEAALDKLTVINQEDIAARKKLIGFAEFSLVEDIFIADPVANAILAFSADGLSIINGPSVQDIADSEAAAAASAAAAAVSAAAAAVSAAAALASENNASDSEVAAAAAAAAAAISAAAALASAAAAALSASQLSGTSVTAVTLGVGAKVFETQAGKFFDAGTFLLVFSDADQTQYMAGQVASYVGTTLTLNVTQFEGAGSPADWTIQVSGKFGVDGAQAPRTVIIVTADLDISDGFTHNTFFQVRPVAEALVTITIPDATTAGFIDGYEGTFHLDVAGSILIDTPSSPPVTEIDGSADLVIADPGKSVTLIASTTTSDWQISQDNRPSETTGVTLFPTTSADPIIAGYVAGVTDNDDVRYDDPSVTITTPVITNAALDRATAEQIFAFISDAGVITDLLDNDLIITVVLNKTPSNARDVRVFTSLYIRDSGGSETLIKETATSGLITEAQTEQNLIFSNVTADIAATDRIVVKAFGFKDVAGGTNPAVQSTLGGKLPSDTPARLKIPQSLTSVSHNATTGLQGGSTGEFYHMTELQNDTFPGIKGADIASANPLVIGIDGSVFDVTGTTDFATMTVAANRKFQLQFDGILTVTNGVSMILPGGEDITTAVGDVWDCQSISANTVIVTNIPVSGGGINQLTTLATTSGTSGSFTIPSGAIRVNLILHEVSDNANSSPQLKVRLGDSGGVETTGYLGAVNTQGSVDAFSIDFHINATAQADATKNISGILTFDKLQGTNTWILSGSTSNDTSTAAVSTIAGQKSLSAELTTIDLAPGATWDNGAISATWES